MTEPEFTKDELRLIARLVRGDHVQRTDKSVRLRDTIRTKIAGEPTPRDWSALCRCSHANREHDDDALHGCQRWKCPCKAFTLPSEATP